MLALLPKLLQNRFFNYEQFFDMTLLLNIRQYRWRVKLQISDNEEKTGNEQSLRYAEKGGESNLV